MKTLNRYIGREVFYATLLIFVALLMLFALFDLIHELGNVGKDGYTLGRGLLFVGLSLPGHVYELMPTAALIGTLFAIAQMVGNSEYTVMRTSGASLTQITVAILRVGIPLAIATFLAGEFFAPPAERLAQQVRMQAKDQATRIVAQQFQSGFWFRQQLPLSTFVNIKSVVDDSGDSKLIGIRVYEFDSDLRLKALRVAETGTFVSDGRWLLKNVQTTELSLEGAKLTRADEFMWETVLKPSILTVYQVAPEKLEMTSLYDNIRVLGGNQQKTSRFEIALWNKVFLSGCGGGDDGSGASLRLLPAPRGRGGVPHFRGHHARTGLLPGRPPLFISGRDQRLASIVFGRIPGRGLCRLRRRDVVVAGAALSPDCRWFGRRVATRLDVLRRHTTKIPASAGISCCRAGAREADETRLRLYRRENADEGALFGSLDGEGTLPSTSAKSVWSLPMPTLVPGWTLVPRWRTMIAPAVIASPP